MRFVVRVPVSNRVASVRSLVEAARLADEIGFYGISVHDRLIFDGRWIACGARDAAGDGDDRDVYEAMVTLAFLAANTTNVRLLTAVMLLPLREPILLAKQVAVLDVLSRGRVILGVGVGGQTAAKPRASEVIDSRVRSANVSKEYVALHVVPDRGVFADEAIAALRAIWTQQRASFAGRHVRFEEIELFPKPVQEGGPPILVGGTSTAAMRRVARQGDGWLPNLLSPESYRSRVEELERLCVREGRHLAIHGLNIFTCIADTDEAAMEIFRPTMGKLFAENDLVAMNLVGSPGSVVARLKEYEAAGVDLVELKPIYRSVPELHAMMRTISREVMPAFA